MTPVRRLAFTLPVIGLAAAVLAAQGEQRPPVFRSRTDIYEIAVTVLDRNRAPVPGLTAGQFTVTEGGRPIRISQFSEVSVPPSAGELPPSAEIASPDLRLSPFADRRLVAIVMDDFSIASWQGAFAQRMAEVTQEIKDAARGIVQSLGPKDFAAVFFTMNPKITPEFTNMWSRLTTSINAFKQPNDILQLELLRSTRGFVGPANTIRDVIAYLDKQPQHSKVIVYIGWPLPGYIPLVPIRLDDVIEDAKASGIPIYGFDPHGPLDRSVTSMILTMTEGTGGGAYGPSNLTQGIPRVFSETGGYYLLGFEPTGVADGRFHKLQVKVNRSGVRVHAPTGYTAVTSKPDMAKPDPAPYDPVLDAALKPLATSEARKLFAYAALAGASVNVSAELDGAEAAKPAWSAGANVGVEVLSGSSVVARATGRIEAGARSTLITVPLSSLPPGLRVNVNVRSTAASFEESAPVQSGGSRLGPPRLFRTTSAPRAPVMPAADFRFRQSEQLRIEWTEQQPVERRQVRLLRRTGDPVGPVPMSAGQDSNGRPTIVATLPLATVAPGEYLIEAIVGDAAATPANTERQLLAFRVIQ